MQLSRRYNEQYVFRSAESRDSYVGVKTNPIHAGFDIPMFPIMEVVVGLLTNFCGTLITIRGILQVTLPLLGMIFDRISVLFFFANFDVSSG